MATKKKSVAKKANPTHIKDAFEPLTFEWWQLSIIKGGSIMIGILLGSYYTEFFLQIELLIWSLAAAAVLLSWFMFFRGEIMVDGKTLAKA